MNSHLPAVQQCSSAAVQQCPPRVAALRDTIEQDVDQPVPAQVAVDVAAQATSGVITFSA